MQPGPWLSNTCCNQLLVARSGFSNGRHDIQTAFGPNHPVPSRLPTPNQPNRRNPTLHPDAPPVIHGRNFTIPNSPCWAAASSGPSASGPATPCPPSAKRTRPQTETARECPGNQGQQGRALLNQPRWFGFFGVDNSFTLCKSQSIPDTNHQLEGNLIERLSLLKRQTLGLLSQTRD